MATNRVPRSTPAAPSARAATTPRPSAIPPAATTGTRTASTISGTSANVPTSGGRVVAPRGPMTACLAALRHDDVGAELFGGAGVFDVGDHYHHAHAARMAAIDDIRRGRPSADAPDGDALVENDLDRVRNVIRAPRRRRARFADADPLAARDSARHSRPQCRRSAAAPDRSAAAGRDAATDSRRTGRRSARGSGRICARRSSGARFKPARIPRPPARETSAASSGPATRPMPDCTIGCLMLSRSQRDDILAIMAENALHRPVRAANLPAPVGPYSPGMGFERFIFVSGQGATDPSTGADRRRRHRTPDRAVSEERAGDSRSRAARACSTSCAAACF